MEVVMVRKISAALIIVMVLVIAGPALAVESEGYITYQNDGNLCRILPDGRGEKVLVKGFSGQYSVSPDGKKIVFADKNRIYSMPINGGDRKLIYEGAKDKTLQVLRWLPDSKSFFFRIPEKDDSAKYFILDEAKGNLKDLGLHYERPLISPSGTYWVYSTKAPGVKKVEVYGGNIGEKGNYIFTGGMDMILSWQAEKDVIIYSKKSKLLWYKLDNRQRQIVNLHLKDIKVIAFAGSTVVYVNTNFEVKEPAMMIYDPDRNVQDSLLDGKKGGIFISHNKNMDKILIFIPRNLKKPMEEGDLYFVDVQKGKAEKLTRDVGERLINRTDLSQQWSPDGKFFVYEKMRLKHSKFKKSEVFVAGEDKNEKLIKTPGIFREPAFPVWVKGE